MDKLYQVRGSSMMPTLADGDVIEIVFGQWKNGDVVVARVGSKNVVKRMVGDKLIGDNIKVSAVFNLPDAIILGKIEKKLHCLANTHLLQPAEASVQAQYLYDFSTRVTYDNFYSISSQRFRYSVDGINVVTGSSSVPANAKWATLESFNTRINYDTYYSIGSPRFMYSVDGINVVTGSSSVPANAKWATLQTFSTRINYDTYYSIGSPRFMYSVDGVNVVTGSSSVPASAKWATLQTFSTRINYDTYYSILGEDFLTYTINSDPVVYLSSPSTNQSFSTAPGRKTITISGTVSDVDNNNVTISAAINGKTKTTVISNTSTAKTWSLVWDVTADNIAEGSYKNILVTADDGMGGIATATMGYILTVDRTAPVISISGVANGQTYQNSVTPIFSATDSGGAGIASVTAALNGVSYTSGTAITSAGSKVLVVTATDHAGNQSQQSVNFTVNKAPVCSLFSPATNQTLAEGQVIVVTDIRFTIRITPNDDAGDTLQYKITQSGMTKVDWQSCSRGIAFDYTFTDLLLGNNVCQVLVRDDRGGQVTRTFTVRNKASGSAAAALSQKGVREVLLALGYPGTAFRCLNDLKPSGYTGPLSFSGIINSLS